MLTLTRRGALLLLVCSACDSTPQSEYMPPPRPSGLLGRWRYDSTGAVTYKRQGQLQYQSSEPMRAGAYLTIDARSWALEA